MRRRPSSRAPQRTPPRAAALRAPASTRARLVAPTHYALARHRPTRCAACSLKLTDMSIYTIIGTIG